jgi:GT2 family glycosyltransferase
MKQDSPAAGSRPPYPGVNIVIAFFNAREYLARCLESVLRHARGDYKIVLVDDASTDTEVLQYVREAAAREPRIVLKRLAQNQGFVAAANEGIRASRGRDVLLLNSDTVATPEFLERLQACVYADGNTGIVSPLSNNATICSIPRFCEENLAPPPDVLDDYASAISAVSLRRRPELVTAVGFCMYIREAVVRAIGEFDEGFGRGFGEENDYCERAKAAGFRIRLCDDVFVAHVGKASFGPAGFELERQNARILEKRYPRYFRDVADFCQRNPLREVQQNIGYHLRRRTYLRSPAVLQLVHASPYHHSPGGTEYHVLDLVRGLALDRALIAFRDRRHVVVAEVLQGDTRQPAFHKYDVGVDYEPYVLEQPAIEQALDRILEDFRVGAAHIHHLFGWPLNLWALLARRRLPVFYTVHDYYCVSPNHNLLDCERFTPCHCPTGHCSERCVSASLRMHGWRLPRPDFVRAHREEFRALLSRVEHVIAPSRKAAAIFRETFHDLEVAITVIPHGLDLGVPPAGPDSLGEGTRLRVGLLGCINHPSKGARNYLALLRTGKSLPVDWHFFGDLEGFDFRAAAESLRAAGRLEFHGLYQRSQIVELLRRHRIDVVVLAPPWDETYSYTLSESLYAGVPVIALRVGALEERLEDAGLGDALASTVAEIAAKLSEICSDSDLLPRWRERVLAIRHDSILAYAGRVRDLYRTPLQAAEQRLAPATLEQQARTFRAFWSHAHTEASRRLRLIDIDEDYPAFWYAAYQRWRGRLPRLVRNIVHERVLAKKSEWLAGSDAASLAKRWVQSGQVRCETIGGKVRLVAGGGDAYVVLPSDLMRGGRVDYLRVRLRTEEPAHASAEIYWVNADGEAFSQSKSFRFPLLRTTEWQEHIIDLRAASLAAMGDGSAPIRHLRLDPLDRPGTVVLDTITLGQFKPWQLETMEPLSA